MPSDLPQEALHIDPVLNEVGADVPHQRVVYAQVLAQGTKAMIVVKSDTGPERFFGAILSGMVLEQRFRHWDVRRMGEVHWNSATSKWEPLQ